MNLKKKVHYKFTLLLSLVLILCGCALFKTPFKEVADQSGIDTLIGDTVFNRVAFRTWEGHVIRFTNVYHRGVFIPAGTECTIKDISKKVITFVANDREYVLGRWLTAVSPEDIKLSFHKFFAEDKNRIGLDKINPAFRDSIESGVDEIGMTKEEILLTLGYPAYLGGTNLTSDYGREFILSQPEWNYLRPDKNRTLFMFKGNKLYKIVD
ncbi:MAG: hypothetical protein JRF30_01655 [Deltaproteobacteria bacterium]|nr:hypothetical protein [Deltaproteobacteria bacterium]MBW1793823.1 hypothetical protein [Deltaproteobacteria bacterium]MBW2329651.1 hypothetical protein [Deltaproteobacteria bacterium]